MESIKHNVRDHVTALVIWTVLGLFAGAALFEYRAHAQEIGRCDNFHKTKPEARCTKCRHASECVRLEDAGPDKQCKMHCNEHLCKCIGPCETKLHTTKTVVAKADSPFFPPDPSDDSDPPS